MVCCPQAYRPQTGWNLKLMMLTPTYLTTNPSEECSQAFHDLNDYYKTSHCPYQVGTHSFSKQEPTVFLLPGKAIKLFSSTLSKTLSLRFNLASVYREAEVLSSTAPICIPTNRAQRFLSSSLHRLQHLLFLVFFDNSHFNRREMIQSIKVLSCISLMISDDKHLFFLNSSAFW